MLPKRTVHSYTSTLVTIALVLVSIVYGLFSLVSPAFAQEEFSEEIFKQRVSPAKFSTVKEGPEFLQPVYVVNSSTQERGFFERASDFIASLVSGDQGFVNFIRPASQPGWSGDSGGISLAAVDLQKSLYPAKLSPSRTAFLASFPSSALSIQSTLLKEHFQKASSSQCVPIPMLLAIAHNETGGVIFGYSEEEIRKFSTPGWWLTSTPEEDRKGFNYNTCDTGAHCDPGFTDVQGPMQFTLATWQGYLPQIQSVLQTAFETEISEEYIIDRRNFRDAIVGAAIKMKADSETSPSQCTTWDEATVKSVARQYFGGCTVSSTFDYCERAWERYQEYSQ